MEEDAITLDNLAQHLKRLTFLDGPYGRLSEWLELRTRLEEGLKRYGLVLDYDDDDGRYVVCASVLEGEHEG